LANPGVPEKSLARTKTAIEDALRKGYAPPGVMPSPGQHGALHEAANALGIGRRTVNDRVATLTAAGNEPDWSLWQDPNTISYKEIHKAKPRVRMRVVTNESPPDGPIRRVAAIGDLHDAPSIPKDRFKWIGRWCAEGKFDDIVQIGDWSSFDSLSTFDNPGSVKYYERGSFADDLASLEESLHLFGQEAPDIPRYFVKGNHEFRADRAEDAAPNLRDTMVLPIDQNFRRHNFKIFGYGEWLFLEGVGFTHIPFNAMGREYRGKYPSNMIANDAIFSIVYGHTHKESHVTIPKIGPSKRIEVCNLGSAMPQNHVEEWANLSMTGWTWGTKSLTLQGGHIIGHEFISMIDLEKRYA